ncbi:MAG: dolichyl-phosphate-mannose--protein mannosyltransferase [Actinomycetota bacterium]
MPVRLQLGEVCEKAPTEPEVHPTVGKWLIGAGIKAFGFDSFGWRIAPAVAGIFTVLLMYLIARKLFGSWIWATLAAGLLAFDPLHFVQSRISMLDIFIPLFGPAAILFTLLDRDRILEAEDAGSWPQRRLTGRPWRIAAGVAGGLALATKWTGGFYLALAIILAFAWEVAARRGAPKAFGRALRQEWLSFAVWMVVLPLAVYTASYIGQIHGPIFTPWQEGSWVREFLGHHRYMWNFHIGLDATHSYQSPPWSWILIKRPVSYYFCSGGSCNPPIAEGDYSEIFAVGNPIVWWTSLLAILGLAAVWLRRRNYRSPEGLILAGVLFTYGPWLVPGADRNAVFIFYLLPTLPFMILALVYWMYRIRASWEGRIAAALFSVGAVAVFFFYLPLLTKQEIPQPQWQKRIWVFDNCDKPPGVAVTTIVTVTEDGKVKESPSEFKDNSSLPPTGFCWI